MFTVCSKCALTLAVTAADLRIGQGYVRCGRCLNIFNALLTLSDEPSDNGGPASAYDQADPASRSQITAALSSAALETEVEVPPYTPAPIQASPVAGPEKQLPTETSSDGSIENESSVADGTGTFETIVLEGDAITQTEEFVPEESVDSEIAALTQRLGVAHAQPIAAPIDPSLLPEHLRPEPLNATTTQITDDGAAAALAELVPAAKPAAGAAGRWGWTLGAMLLVLLVAAQAVNHWRDALAASPSLGAPITRAYAALGVPLDPHWNLAAYDVRQQGADADSADPHIIHVRLSVSNNAARSQPAPLLRLTLLDRYGKRIATRDLTPAEYWPRGQTPRPFLLHDERVDSDVAVRDPDSNSASFELDVCLRDGQRPLRCASDQPAGSSP